MAEYRGPERRRRHPNDTEVIIIDLPDRINRFERAILEGIHDLKRMLQPLIQEIHVMAGELDALTTQVQANTDAEESAILLLGNLSDLIRAAANDPAKINALATQLSTSKDRLAAAIVANTPSA